MTGSLAEPGPGASERHAASIAAHPAAMRRYVGALLRREAPVWPFGDEPAASERFAAFVDYHGITALVAAAAPSPSDWPATLHARLANACATLTALELLRQREIARVVAAFAQAGLRSLLLKGTALAYSLYPEPIARPRTDTDVLIDAADRDAAHALLLRLGYREQSAIDGELVSTQRLYLRQEAGTRHAIDLHWAISNAAVFAREFAFDELHDRSRSVLPLGAAARMPAYADALLHACLHRANHAHKGEHDRLQWIYDMHLLASHLDADAWSDMQMRAERKGLRFVCADALTQCVELLHTAVPDRVIAALSVRAARRELSAALLRGGVMPSLLVDFRALPDWRARARLLREHLFPDADYMRVQFGVSSRPGLIAAYAWRLLRAPLRLTRRARTAGRRRRL